MGDLHLVRPALNFFTLDAGILMIVHQVRLKMTPPLWLKVIGWVVVVAHRILVSAPVPLMLIRGLNWVGLGWGWA